MKKGLEMSKSTQRHGVSDFARSEPVYGPYPPLRRADGRPSPAATPVPKFQIFSARLRSTGADGDGRSFSTKYHVRRPPCRRTTSLYTSSNTLEDSFLL